MIAGIAIDAWKLTIFRKHLSAAGCTFTEHPGLTANTLLLKVTYESVAVLEPVVRAANTECAERDRS